LSLCQLNLKLQSVLNCNPKDLFRAILIWIQERMEWEFVTFKHTKCSILINLTSLPQYTVIYTILPIVGSYYKYCHQTRLHPP